MASSGDQRQCPCCCCCSSCCKKTSQHEKKVGRTTGTFATLYGLKPALQYFKCAYGKGSGCTVGTDGNNRDDSGPWHAAGQPRGSRTFDHNRFEQYCKVHWPAIMNESSSGGSGVVTPAPAASAASPLAAGAGAETAATAVVAAAAAAAAAASAAAAQKKCLDARER